MNTIYTSPSALVLTLFVAVCTVSCGVQSQSTAPEASGGSSSATPSPATLGSPMGQPMGLADGASQPLQRSVDASRRPLGADLEPAAASSAQPNAKRVDGASGAAQTPTADGATAPLTSAASVGSDYRIGPNDLVDFNVFGVPDMQRTVRINASGVASFPLIGSVSIAGLTTAQAEAMISGKYAKEYLQNPQVSLFIREFTSQRITIEGAVGRPGIYPVTGRLTLLRALALAGGGAQYAQLSEVMLFRSAGDAQAKASQMFDLDKIRTGEVADPEIRADDVIVVKRDPKRTALRDSLLGDVLSTFNPFK